MIKYSRFVNDHTINIFTDASILQVTNKNMSTHFIGALGYIAFLGNSIIHQYTEVRAKTTNNYCEIHAIRLAVEFANSIYDFNNPKTINIFSDSKISIYGLREWIYKWIQTVDQNGTIYSTSGPVKNQEEFLATLYLILSKNLRINFYHVRGHHDHGTQKEFIKFRESFRRENHITEMVEDTLINYLILGNSMVDNLTRGQLSNQDLITQAYISEMMYEKRLAAIQYGLMASQLDMNKYQSLIGGNNNDSKT